MKKLIPAALLSLAVVGSVHADDAPPAPEAAPAIAPAPIDDGGIPVAPEGAISANPLKSPLGIDGNLAGQTYEVRGYSEVLSPPVGRVLLGAGAGAVAEGKIGPGGVYQVPGLRPGLYTVVVNTPQGFGAEGAYVDVAGSGPGPVAIETGLVPPQDFGFVREVAMSTSSSGLDAAGGQVLPPELVNGLAREAAFQIGGDGSTVGYLAIPGPVEVRAADHMMVWFVRDGQPVAKAETDDKGYFSVAGLQPGWHTFVASGKYGFAALSVEVAQGNAVAADLIGNAIGQDTQLVQGPAGVVSICPGSDLNLIRANLPTPGAFAPAPQGAMGAMFGGGGGGFGGGGGGMGGGLGGLGALLGAAGLGLGAAALADDDDVVIIVTPAGP